MRFVLPWPPKELSPNARAHFMVKARAAKIYRHTAYWLAIEAGAHGAPVSALSLTFHPPRAGRADLDNMLARCKAQLDGIADAFGVDDSNWSLTITKGEPIKGGQVVVEVSG